MLPRTYTSLAQFSGIATEVARPMLSVAASPPGLVTMPATLQEYARQIVRLSLKNRGQMF